MRMRVGGIILLMLPLMVTAEGPRTNYGKPDFSGFYDVATMTPLQRPSAAGDKKSMTREDAQAAAKQKAQGLAFANRDSDPERGAPPAGGDGSRGAAGNVGGYNAFWIANGDSNFAVDGEFRTSIIYDPANGRQPARTQESRDRLRRIYGGFRQNSGEAWWLEVEGPGPYDNPESRTLSDRCLLGFGSTSGPPALPTLYNNFKRIVQTEQHVMILNEMVHDARVVRMDSEHVHQDIRNSMGDSIGWWEDDTLVIDTTNFNDRPGLGGASRNLHVIERLSRTKDGTLLYGFTVDDPDTWVASWSGEYTWPEADGIVYEYACHEGNIAMGNILRGARLLESEHKSAKAR